MSRSPLQQLSAKNLLQPLPSFLNRKSDLSKHSVGNQREILRAPGAIKSARPSRNHDKGCHMLFGPKCHKTYETSFFKTSGNAKDNRAECAAAADAEAAQSNRNAKLHTKKPTWQTQEALSVSIPKLLTRCPHCRRRVLTVRAQKYQPHQRSRRYSLPIHLIARKIRRTLQMINNPPNLRQWNPLLPAILQKWSLRLRTQRLVPRGILSG